MASTETAILKFGDAASAGGRGPSLPEHQFAFRIADTTFSLSSNSVRMMLNPTMDLFALPHSERGVQVSAVWTNKVWLPEGRPAFESGGVWSVFRHESGWQFRCASSAFGETPYKSAWFNADFTEGQVELFKPYFDAGQPLYPLEYPLDELVMIHRLARGEGVEMHAVGVVDEDGRGHLFVGHSGAGKSTLARLWQRESRALILSDDRIILRERGGRIWMHGTPWHGDAGIASPEAAPLCSAYLIEHGTRPELRPVPKGRAVAELLARSFVPHYSAEAMDFTLGFLGRVARETPCFVFRFFPDQSAVEAIRLAHA